MFSSYINAASMTDRMQRFFDDPSGQRLFAERRAIDSHTVDLDALLALPTDTRGHAYAHFLRSRGLLHGLAAGTNWVLRDESAHMAFAFEAVRTIRREEPELFDDDTLRAVRRMFEEAVACETQFAEDLLGGGVAGLSVAEVRGYLEYCADQRLATLGLPKIYGARNPLAFMDLQDVQELSNFFERRVSSYQVGVTGTVEFDQEF